uniref:Uncharacterized protein n=1 Tax=Anopheles arabiensis TaxID=7173 RepID=A0A182I4L6_ANOAR
MLPTSSYPCLAALRSAASLPCTPARPKAALAMVLLMLALVLPLPGAVLGDYENTWNSYYEQPCCGGTTNGPFHLRHHGEFMMLPDARRLGLSWQEGVESPVTLMDDF